MVSKLFNTVKYLLLKTGFLLKEYVKGSRTSYLHPFRLYGFTSVFFPIVFFSPFSIKDKHIGIARPGFIALLAKGYAISESEMLKQGTSKSDAQLIRNAFMRCRIPIGHLLFYPFTKFDLL
jgi:hypothetical protein